MAPFIFDCPCCGENHVLNLAVSFEPTGNVDPEDWKAFLRVANKVTPKFQESEKFKKWQEAMA
jgi:hypothetical protein